MAKLSARGRLEIARFEKEQPSFDPERIINYIITRALMSDGNILEKARWDSKNPQPWGTTQKTAWRIHAKVKVPNETWIKIMTKSGWKKL